MEKWKGCDGRVVIEKIASAEERETEKVPSKLEWLKVVVLKKEGNREKDRAKRWDGLVCANSFGDEKQ